MTMDPSDDHVVDPIHTPAANAPAAPTTMPQKAKSKRSEHDSREATLARLGRAHSDSLGSAIKGGASTTSGAAGLLARVRDKVGERSTPVLSDVDASSFRRELLRGEWSLLDLFDRDGKRFFTWGRTRGGSEKRAPLTKREKDVLERVALGQSDRSIALELRCSSSTVATHRLRAMSKLGLRSRALFSQILASVSADDGT